MLIRRYSAVHRTPVLFQCSLHRYIVLVLSIHERLEVPACCVRAPTLPKTHPTEILQRLVLVLCQHAHLNLERADEEFPSFVHGVLYPVP